ncbi:MAG TPA: pyridoxamine 5'-phosphate oxidase family protein [Acidisarcina sp.]
MSYGSIAFTPLVKKLQERYGSRRQYERMEGGGEALDKLGDFEEEFLGERDSFYWATISATGWPYIQHRGGPRGFLKVVDDKTLAFADYRGNRQYITTGNLLTDDRVAMIMIDYPRRARLKILGRAKISEGHEADRWLNQVRVAGYKAIIERVFVIHVEGLDWNCAQHITPRYTAAEIHEEVEALEARFHKLEQENKMLRDEIAKLSATLKLHKE